MSCETNSTVSPRSDFLGDPLEAALLKRDVADREDFVGQEDVGLHVDRDRERQPQVHAARILPQRVVEKLVQLGELDDVRHAVEHLAPRDAVHRGVHQDVVVRREVRIESGAELQQRDHATDADTRPSVGRVTRAMILSSVDLPAPLAPMMPRIVLRGHSRTRRV